MSQQVARQPTGRGPMADAWAHKIKERSNWACEGCGMSERQIKALGGTLEAAHILPWNEFPEHRLDLDNGKSLCTFRNRRHPQGLGHGYGCHNAMSGHWNAPMAHGGRERGPGLRGVLGLRRHWLRHWIAASFWLWLPVAFVCMLVAAIHDNNAVTSISQAGLVHFADRVTLIDVALPAVPVVLRAAWRSRSILRRRSR